MSSNNSLGASIAAGVDASHESRGWFLALGIALIVLGAICIAGEVTATLVTVLTLGWLLIFGSLLALIQAFRVHNWSGVLPLLPDYVAAGSHRIPAGALSVQRGSESDADSGLLLHRRRRIRRCPRQRAARRSGRWFAGQRLADHVPLSLDDEEIR